jgi:hypothetical protein
MFRRAKLWLDAVPPGVMAAAIERGEHGTANADCWRRWRSSRPAAGGGDLRDRRDGWLGKTTFAVYAAHRLAPGFGDGRFFSPLRAQSAGQASRPGGCSAVTKVRLRSN